MKQLSLNEYQDAARATAVFPYVVDGSNLPIYPTLGLVGESGEFAEKMKKIIRDKGGVVGETDAADLALELGDVLWYTANLAHLLGYTLNEVANMNLTKLASRKARGTLQGKGDHR